MKAVTPEVVEIGFNSFCKLRKFASYLSKVLDAPVVVNIYQSTATASYWGYHLRGKCLREIEAGDGVVYFQSGALLTFESKSIRCETFEGNGKTFSSFDYEDQEQYNKNVNIPVKVYQEPDSMWKNFIIHVPSKKFW